MPPQKTRASFQIERQGAIETTMSKRGQGPEDSFPGFSMQDVRNDGVASEQSHIEITQ